MQPFIFLLVENHSFIKVNSFTSFNKNGIIKTKNPIFTILINLLSLIKEYSYHTSENKQ
ncbi:hypothetical protein M949_0175 [Riemerella anatipestifer CH3]|nr:hypothetical protein M949_0175 [Riemerella anatipestifer CH3]